MNDLAEFLGTGLVVLPTLLGFGMDDASAFFISFFGLLALFLVVLVIRTRPAALPPEDEEK